MRKCDICKTEQKEIGELTFGFINKDGNTETLDIKSPMYNIDLMTFIKGKHICNKCMDTYRKIHALHGDMDFSCGGQKYYSDGRNL